MELADRKYCCFCSGEFDLRSLLLPYTFQGQTEVYANLIEKCFCIKLLTQNDDPGKNKYVICEICVTRLRDALQFRNQVEIARDSIQKEIENRIKLENHSWNCLSEHFNSIKTEINVEDDGFQNENISNQFSVNVNDKKLTQVKKEEPSDVNEIKLELTNEIEDKKTNLNIAKDSKLTNKLKSARAENSKTTSGIKKKPIRINFIKRKVDKADQDRPIIKLNKNDRSCKVCNETFNSFIALSIHMAVHFPNFICQVCGKFFVTNKRLHCHLKIHENKPLSCNVCNKVFENSSKLENHRRFHRNKYVYSCPHCTERFFTYWDRLKHLINVHNQEAKQFKCEHCSQRFNLSGQLTRHIKLRHLHQKKFDCDICDRSFALSQTLKDHINSHYAIKNYQCDICKKSFGKRYTLTEHLKIHYNIKNYVCPVCNKAFTQKCTLKGHLKVHEKVQVSTI